MNGFYVINFLNLFKKSVIKLIAVVNEVFFHIIVYYVGLSQYYVFYYDDDC